MKKFSDIKVCIWDFDGTLYRQSSALWNSILESELQVIIKHTSWTKEKAQEEFQKVHNVVTPSGTKTVSIITKQPLSVVSEEMSKLTDYESYVKKDPKLTTLFTTLSDFGHYILTNGSTNSISRGLGLLGLAPSFFDEIVTSELLGESKPSRKGFDYIVKKTGLLAQNHLMIGDREEVDIVPAKTVGMKTALVWSEQKSTYADVTLPTVYDVASILL